MARLARVDLMAALWLALAVGAAIFTVALVICSRRR